MKISKLVLAITVLFNAFSVIGQPPVPSGRRLRIIAEDLDHIIIGATTGSWAFGGDVATVLDREFSYVTPENDFKQNKIHPDPATWHWSQTDAWVQHIADNNQRLRIHGPISPQCSHWVKDTNRTAAELETILLEFMEAVSTRYNNVSGFEYMDVVNETVLQGHWRTNTENVYQPCPWYKIGQDTDANQTPLYIKKAFQTAQQFAPDMKFIFNQNSLNDADWELIKETIIYLRNDGLRVDGIGWQAHVDNGWATPENLNKLRNLIDWAQQNNLEFHVTEVSVHMENTSSGNLQLQADTYRAILDVLLEKRFTGEVGWNTWYLNDDEYTQGHPALFDSMFVAKPAYYAVQEALENGVTEIHTAKNEDRLAIEPNPTRGIFQISGQDLLSVRVTDSSGHLVKQINGKETSPIIVDLANTPKGLYFLEIATKDGLVVRRLVLK